MLGSLPALGRTNMLCTHNPVMGVPICVFLFAIAIVATIWKAISLMITRQRNLGLPSYAKPFSCFLLGVVNIVFSFYFLLRCVTHNWNWGYEMSLEHELRSSDFGFAGLLWFVSMLLILTAIRMVYFTFLRFTVTPFWNQEVNLYLFPHSSLQLLFLSLYYYRFANKA